MTRAAIGAVLLMLAVARKTTAQEAPGIDTARRLYLEADFRQARAVASNIVDTTRSPSELVEALRLLVAVEFVLGDETGARAHASSLVALDPNITPPEGAPEPVADLLAQARQAPLRLTLSPSQGTVRVAVAEAPPLATALDLECEQGVETLMAHGTPSAPPSLSIDARRPASCRATLRTTTGITLGSVSRLVPAELPSSPVVLDPPPPRPAPPVANDETTLHIGVVVGISALIVAGAVTVVVVESTRETVWVPQVTVTF